MKSKSLAFAVLLAALLSVPGAVWAQAAGPNKVRADKLPPTIPIFPLEDPMLFPNISRPLHIFEPRYRAMIADALKGDRIIGMVTLKPGFEPNYEGRPPIYPIGCAGVITDVEELPDGRYNIVLQGLVKFRVNSEDQSRPYRLARVDALPEFPSPEEQAALRKQRQRLESLVVEPGSDRKFPPQITDEDVVNTLSQYLELDPPERQALLELKGALARSQALIDLLELQTILPR